MFTPKFSFNDLKIKLFRRKFDLIIHNILNKIQYKIVKKIKLKYIIFGIKNKKNIGNIISI